MARRGGELWAIVGRFRCRNSSCLCKIFCERLPQIARVYGRQTERTAEIVRLLGYVAGGLPGQRLLARLSIATRMTRFCDACGSSRPGK
jgi:hypothetical protein